MCMVSNIGDEWTENFPKKWPMVPMPVIPLPEKPYAPQPHFNFITQEQFEALKKEVEELKKLLLAAKKFDEETGQPECEVEDKVKLIKQIAQLVGVNLDDVFKEKK